MEFIDVALLVVASIANAGLAFVSVIKNPKNITNRLFALLVFTLIGWTTANYFALTATSNDIILFSVELLLTLVILQNVTFLFFVLFFPDGKYPLYKHKAALTAYILFSGFALIAGLSGLFFDGYVVVEETINPQPTPFIGLFSLHAAVSIITAMTVLVTRERKAAGVRKNQLKFLLLASGILFGLVPLTNFILPNAFDIAFFNQFSPIYALMFALVISYTMIRHNLLDFSALAAKTVTYAFTVIVLALAYGFIGVWFSNLVFSEYSTLVKDIATFTLAILLAIAAGPLLIFFDQLTSRFFYRRHYSPQSLLDSLNKTLVETTKVDDLLQKSVEVLSEYLNVTHATVYIHETSYMSHRIISSDETATLKIDTEVLQDLGPNVKTKVSLLQDDDGLPSGVEQFLQNMGAVALIRLVTNLEYPVHGIGYIILGPKKSGGLFSKDEERLLEIIANELVIAIDNALKLEEIEEFNVTLQSKIDSATKELKDSNKKLLALDEAKDEFVSMASHQLRTPLTSIKGYISMVLEGDAGKINETQTNMLKQAFISSQRMVYLIADLLNVSRLKTGKFIIEAREVDIKEIVSSEVEQLQDAANAKQQKLILKTPDSLPSMMFDEMKTRQVIMNLIDNAIYYSPSGGEITVSLKKKKQAVEFTVKDDGMGVPKKDQKNLFTKFYRAENARKSRPDGTGLGLFMAKKVIDAQKGDIVFDSAEGRGSTFGFTLPTTTKEKSA